MGNCYTIDVREVPHFYHPTLHKLPESKFKPKSLDPVKFQEDLISNKKIYGSDFDTMHQIAPFIFLGGCVAAENKIMLSKNDIACILNVAPSSVDCYYKQSIKYVECDIRDTSDMNIYPYFKACSEWLDKCVKDKLPVLVHCFAGSSRSGAIVVAHLMISREISLDCALEIVKSKRSIVKPNDGFMKQLRMLEEEIQKIE